MLVIDFLSQGICAAEQLYSGINHGHVVFKLPERPYIVSVVGIYIFLVSILIDMLLPNKRFLSCTETNVPNPFVLLCFLMLVNRFTHASSISSTRYVFFCFFI